MSHATVGKWGKNLAIRFPAELARSVGLNDGEQVEIEAQDGTILIRRTAKQDPLEHLFQARPAAEWRRAYAGAYDWGPDIGRESVPE